MQIVLIPEASLGFGPCPMVKRPRAIFVGLRKTNCRGYIHDKIEKVPKLLQSTTLKDSMRVDKDKS